MTVTMHSAAERPDLWERGVPSVWPEYNKHGDVMNRWWDALGEDFPEFQFVLYDEARDAVVAEGQTGPLWWDGEESVLPDGIDASIEQIFDRSRAGRPANTLCALAGAIPPDGRGRGLAEQLLEAMRTTAERHGLAHLVAPVRPSLKEHYPLTPMDRYVQWRRDDGQLFDPWMRVHERLGARVSTPLPRSLLITGTTAEWERWTGMVFPESGKYVFPHGLAPVHIDRAGNVGTYWEPNVWMVHPHIAS